MTEKNNFYLKQFEIGAMQNFVYFIGDNQTKEIAVVDPAWDTYLIRREAQKEQLKITAILLTHGHYDHVEGVKDLLSTNDIPVYISEKDAKMLKFENSHIRETKPGELIKIGNLEITCLHTPGHTPGCQCFLANGVLLSGDTLFINGCGRCDLAGGDPHAMYNSLYRVISKLPDDTIIYAGHNYDSKLFDTLANQKKTNPYLTCANEEEFLKQRMGF